MTPEEEQFIKEERAKKFKSMGIPQPIPQGLVEEAARTATGGKDAMSRLDQIRRGALKKDFQKIISKVESGTIVHPSAHQEIPTGAASKAANGQQPQQKFKAPALETFDQPRVVVNEATEAESIMYGNSSRQPQYQQEYQEPQQYNEAHVPASDEFGYGPPAVDYHKKLEQKLNVTLPVRKHENPNVQQPAQDRSVMNNTLFMKKLTELETRMQDMVMDVSEQIALKLINEMTSEIATEVAKKTAMETTKRIILEFGKQGKHILIESAKVKRAEVVAADKVKIDGKVYKLTEVKG